MEMRGRLIVLLAITALYSTFGHAATGSTDPNGVAATNGVTVTTLAAPPNAATSTAVVSTTSSPTPSTAEPTATAVATKSATTQTATSTPAATVTVVSASSAAPTAAAPLPPAAPVQTMQEQPTTVIEAAPLATSNADDLRKVEEQTEIETEQKIAERLEQERIAAEKQRQQEILNSMNSLTSPAAPSKPQAAQAPAQPTSPAVVVVAAPAAQNQSNQQPEASLTKDDVQAMVKEDLSSMRKPKNDSGRYFFSGTIGQINYHSSDVNSFGSGGLSFGKEFSSNWDVSADFGYADNNISQSLYLFQQMQQYSLGMTARYVFFNGRIRPSLGGAVDYVRRQYSGLQDAYATYTTYGGSPLGQETSDAVDAGVVADVDLMMSDNFSLGLEYRYMTNVGYRYEGQNWLNSAAYRDTVSSTATPLEQQGYDLTSLVIRYLF